MSFNKTKLQLWSFPNKVFQTLPICDLFIYLISLNAVVDLFGTEIVTLDMDPEDKVSPPALFPTVTLLFQIYCYLLLSHNLYSSVKLAITAALPTTVL